MNDTYAEIFRDMCTDAYNWLQNALKDKDWQTKR